MKKKSFLSELHPTKILVYGFLSLILVGSILLSMPFSSASGSFTNYIDSLFTATSAVCVTGLVVRETATHWSTTGKLIIMFLIQMGGLGIMTTVTLGMFIAGKRVSLYNRIVLQESLSASGISGVVRMTKRIIYFTFSIEFIGALILSFSFIPKYGVGKGIFMSVFHSISAFCNAGFDLVGGSSLEPFVLNPFVTLPVMLLIVFGGLGFHVLDNILAKITKKAKLTLHSKFVLTITLILLLVGFFAFYLFESEGSWSELNVVEKIQTASFQSVTTRTAGFATTNQNDLSDSSKILTNILMFIGGSPGSTAGGVKTTTIGVILLAVFSVILNKKDNEVYGRRISEKIIKRATTVVIIGLILVLSTILILSFTEKTLDVDSVTFEVISAFGTVGLSTGITPSLTSFAKLLLSVVMFFGRVGPVTILVAMSSKIGDKNILRLPKGRIYIG